MNGIFGITSYNIIKDISKSEVETMGLTMADNPENIKIFYAFKAILANVNKDTNNNLLTRYDCQKSYTISFDGFLLNKEEIINKLSKYGYNFTIRSDAEAVVNAYIHYKENCLSLLKGQFSFVIYDGNSIFIAKDKLGTRPLYYAFIDNKFVFSSKISSLFKFKNFKPIIDKNGFIQLMTIAPMALLDQTIYKGISSVKPGEFVRFINNRVEAVRYYNLPSKKNSDSFSFACENIKNIINNTVSKQVKDYKQIGSLLSGGLDSAIISKTLSKNHKINTYFLDYLNNKDNIKATEFITSHDLDSSRIMAQYLDSNHHELTIDSKTLFNGLKESALARSLPGMADIDSSLCWLGKQVVKNDSILFSGEFADEIFLGYPWSYKELEKSEFNWIRNLNFKTDLLKKPFSNYNYQDFVDKLYNESIKEIEFLPNESNQNKLARTKSYLNIYYFGQQLLLRNYFLLNKINVYSPFSDCDLVEYVYNLPYEYKYQLNKEKYILKQTFKDDLPIDIIEKKKNPYPKTADPLYFDFVANKVLALLSEENSFINRFFDAEKIKQLCQNKKEEIPWYGQLMGVPQFLGYLIQIDYLVKEYQIDFEL